MTLVIDNLDFISHVMNKHAYRSRVSTSKIKYWYQLSMTMASEKNNYFINLSLSYAQHIHIRLTRDHARPTVRVDRTG